MRLVLADIDEAKLAEAAKTLPVPPDALLARRVDVSREADIAALADEAFDRFGAVHLLCNNAGVGLTRLSWELTTADWEWILGVNLWSVVHAIHHFVPRMLAQDGESHVVNTASVAGLLSTPAMAAYNVSKHGVVTLSETLYTELAAQNAEDRRLGAMPSLGADRHPHLGAQPAGALRRRGAALGRLRRLPGTHEPGGEVRPPDGRRHGQCRLRRGRREALLHHPAQPHQAGRAPEDGRHPRGPQPDSDSKRRK